MGGRLGIRRGRKGFQGRMGERRRQRVEKPNPTCRMDTLGVEVVVERDEKPTQRVILTRWVDILGVRRVWMGFQGGWGWASMAEGRETHPTCRFDTLGGQWVVIEGGWD